MQYCCLLHHTLLLSPVISITGYCFCFGSIPSFFLELFLHSSPVAYWAPTDLGSSSFGILSFCLFILFMGFSNHWSGLPFPSPVYHILSALSTMTHQSWVTHAACLNFIELDTAVVLWSDWLVFRDYDFTVSALWCPLTTPTLLFGFLWPWTWGISSQENAAKCSHCSSPWMWGICSWLPLLTNPQLVQFSSVAQSREYQIVRTHRKEITWIQDRASPNHQSTLFRMPYQNKKQNKNTNPSSADRSITSLILTHQRRNKQTKLSTNLSLYEDHTNHWTNLSRAETKRKKEFNLCQEKNSTLLEAWEKETSNTVSLETNKQTNKTER